DTEQTELTSSRDLWKIGVHLGLTISAAAPGQQRLIRGGADSRRRLARVVSGLQDHAKPHSLFLISPAAQATPIATTCHRPTETPTRANLPRLTARLSSHPTSG